MTGFGARRVAARVAVRVATVVAVAFATSYPSYAGTSPLGDTAAPWPAAWNAYRLDTGAYVQDVLGDENPSNADLSSGPCAPNGCTGGSPTVYYASDGTTAFFRVRLAVDPADASKGGLTGNAYLTQLAVGGTVRAVVGVDGKSPSLDYVYTATAPGTTVTSVYEYPFTSPSAGMRVVPDGGGQYFLDYQVPIARITTASGGTITAATPIQLYYGSSAAANLATINKDFMLGTATAVDFSHVAVVSLTPGSLTTTSGAVVASGANPPAVGSVTTYTLTLTATNPGGGDVSGSTVTATLPAGVTYVSGPVSMAGADLTWSAGTLLPGQTKTVDVVVSFTPPSSGTVPLLSATAASGTDVGTGVTKTATAPALTVTAVANAAPVAAADTLTVAEDGSGTVDVLANDTDADPITVTSLTQPAHGSVTESGGVVTYTPDADYHGPDLFTYTVCDDQGGCDTATVTVTVTAGNDAPPSPPGTSFSTPEDTAATGTLPGSVDPDGDPLTFSVTDQPAHGSVTVGTDGSYTYTPDPGYTGSDAFGYQVCDPSGACAAADVTVTVTPVNDPPAPPPGDAVTTPEDTAASGTLPGSVDPDGDALTFGVTDQPAHGSVTVGTDGSYTYTPDPDYTGSDTFGYQVCDPAEACAAAVVTVTVTPVNDAPVATDDDVATGYGDAVTFDPSGNDTDADGDALSVLVSDPPHGAVTVSGNDVTYTPDAGWSGPDSFTYVVCDGAAACDTGTVTVTTAAGPAPVNHAPVADAGADRSVPSGTAVALDGSGSSDPDGDPLTYAWVQTGGPAVVLSGASTATPSFGGVVGPAVLTFALTVSDGTLSDVASVTITVAPPAAAPDAPDCDAVSVTTDPGGITVSVPCDDDAGATYEVVSEPAHGDAEVLDTGEVRYVPEPGFTGTDEFTVRVCTAAGCTSTVVTVDVHDVAVTRPRAVDGVPAGLPTTGSPMDVLVAAAFVMVVLGTALQRRPRPRQANALRVRHSATR